MMRMKKLTAARGNGKVNFEPSIFSFFDQVQKIQKMIEKRRFGPGIKLVAWRSFKDKKDE